MDRTRPTGKLLDWRSIGTRPLGRPRQRWQENIMEDLKKLKVKNWKETAKGRRLGCEGENPQMVVVPNDDESVAVFCACKIIQLVFVVFCVVRVVHKFDFKTDINDTPYKCGPVERSSYSDRICMFLTGSVCF
jgi:hypothetical protein